MRRRLWVKAGVGVVAAALAAPAAAQDRTRGRENEEIVITARHDSAIGEIGQGVVVLPREAVLETLGQGLGETLESTPGVSSSFFGAGASRPIIRGLGEDRIRVLSNGLGQIDASSVSPDHAVTAEGLEADRVEVLRGPAALAYGGDAVGGVVNVIDTRIAERLPEEAASAEVYAGLTTGLDASAAAGRATFAHGGFVARIDGFVRDAGDYEIPGYAESAALRAQEIADGADPADFARDVAPNTFTEAEQIALGVSFVGENGFIGASARRFETLYGIPEGVHEHEGEADADAEEEEAAIFAGPRIDMEQTRYEARAAWTKPFVLFESLRADVAVVDYEHAEIEPSGEVGTLFSNEGYEARLEAEHRPLGGLGGLWGVTYATSDFAAIGEEAFITPTERSDWGVFIDERFERGALSLDGGVRYDRRELDNVVFGSRDFDALSASISAGWRPNDLAFFALTAARTERAPTETELFSFGPHLATASFEIGDPSLDVETALSLEGVARLRGERASLTVSAFAIDFSDFIAAVPTGLEQDDLPEFAYVQRDANFVGGEIEGALTLVETGKFRLGADAAFEIVRAEFDGGGDVPRIPPETITVGAEAGWSGLETRLEWVRAFEQDRVAAFETPTDGYDLLNARLSWRPVAEDARLTFLLDGRNLTDEEARVHASRVKDLLPRPGRSVRFAVLGRF